ncbi:D-alanyl-D-alanine carboxypeptidase [Micromonospora endophytica]|uniref:D-alanyl-D-alanine carboxypeptidase n=1 Tax=Micromonospora endophytica TaxID=515350 RepID=A0A2W2CM04_9ACTN|nr:D-alanyl-D-alanine carboxypeptidase [Micromonospora endophytica]RIW45798.1 class A beta-lactamase-related serine hydrolase [Micromonospora endophytica]BCJ61957.1 hydrolase [Micromonospora endophytica]
MSSIFRTLKSVATSVTLVATIAVVPASAAAQPDASAGGLDRAELRAALAAVPEAGAPGALAAVRDGRHEWRDAAGQAFLTKPQPMKPEMRHRIGSITKTFIATTVLQLVDEGRLGLDDPIGTWLPDLVPGEPGAQVTVRMLLNHTSGIGNYTNAMIDSYAAINRMQVTTYAPADLVAMGLAMPPTNAPGARFSYSNTNYLLAGLLIEKVTGNGAAAEVQRRILRPLKLTGTSFPGTDPTIRGPHGGAYFASFGARDLSEFNMSWAWTAGEMISTTADLNTFFRALLRGDLLSQATLDEMLDVVPMLPDLPEAAGYGLGIYSLRTPCGEFWGHDGAVIGHLTYSLHSRDGTRQVSSGINLSHYQIGLPDPHPIDIAWQTFLLTAMCPTSETNSRSAEAVPQQLPSVTRMPGNEATVTLP